MPADPPAGIRPLTDRYPVMPGWSAIRYRGARATVSLTVWAGARWAG